MTPITHNGWRLVDAQGYPVMQGSVRPDFRGDCAIITGGLCPHKDGSTGYVYTQAGREFYPSVYDLKWEKEQ